MRNLRIHHLLTFVPAGVLLLLAGCSAAVQAPALTPEAPRLKVFDVLPAVMASSKNPITGAKVDLGRMLYYDTRLSLGQDISCNSCHKLDAYGVDGEPTSLGHRGQRGDRNSPSVYNAAGQFVQFWDGRAADVEEQAKGPVLNPEEMAMPSEQHVVVVLKSIPGYAKLFKAAFPDAKDPITFDNMALAIGAFERKLVTPSRWDKFLGGDATALNGAELAGLQVFLDTNCQTCHLGPYVGGTMYQKLGLVKPWPDQSDSGREQVTGKESDRMMFKVPSLRNVIKTGPYFHDGKTVSIEEAVTRMAEYQLGKELSRDQVVAIVTFLGALTGELPLDYIKQPELPKSGPKTPQPDVSD